MKPSVPMVAMKANARVTPPNWESTPQSAVTRRRMRPSGDPVATV